MESTRAKKTLVLLIPFVNLQDVFGVNEISTPPLGLVNATPEEIRRYSLKVGDVLFVRSSVKPSGVGLTAVVTNELEQTMFSGFIIRFRQSKTKLITPFLKFCFYEPSFRRSLLASSSISANTNINQKSLEKLTIAVPPRHEQEKVAAILSSVDEAIASTQAVIDQTRKVKQGLLQQLLTRGIGHTRFKESAIGEIPEEWEIKPAEQLCTRIAVGIVIKPTQYYVKSGIPCFRSANVQEGYVQDRDWVYISEESNNLLAKSQLQAGDVLVVRTGYPGTSCVVPKKFDGTNCIDIIFARPNKNLISPEYLSWFINSSLGKKQVLQGQGGLAQQHFNVGSLNCMQISVPPLEEQKRIVDIFYSIQSTISQAEVELENLSNLKRGLMQDLLTGRVRVGGMS
jgi:type I restriction enzyme S subunit